MSKASNSLDNLVLKGENFMNGTTTTKISQKNPIANPLILLREEFDDWAVLFNPDEGDGFGLNPVSVFIWKHLDGKHSISEITEKLRNSCDDVPENAQELTEAFVEELLSKGLAGYAET